MKTLASIRLTDNQKRVLSKIVASPTPKVAGEQISDDENLVAATNMLVKLGLVQVSPAGEASLTDQGNQIMQQEALVDETGQLTDDGNKFAFTDKDGTSDEDLPKQPDQTEPFGGPALPTGPQETTPTMPEGREYGRQFTLIKELLN